MTEKINKLYKPKELEEAQHILKECSKLDFSECSDLLIALHNKGWRVIKC